MAEETTPPQLDKKGKTRIQELDGVLLNYYSRLITDVIVSSAFEAEYAALFLNVRHSVYLCNILEDLGYPQPPTAILCDNKFAVGIANDTA